VTISRPVARATTFSGVAGRDSRIDLLRGGALVVFAAAVLAKVVEPASQAYDSTATVTAVALVITLEGALIGMIYRPRLGARLGESSLRLWRRARSWYLSCLAVVALIAVFGLATGIDIQPITALETSAHPYLFGMPPADEASLALTYPLDPDVLLAVILLRVGPWPLDIAVLIVALLAIAPLCMLALSRGRWVLLVLVSLALYGLELATDVRILPTRAEANLPILGWQLVFVLGMTAGHFRRELVQWFRRGSGLVLYLLLTLVAVTWLVLPAVLTLTNSRAAADPLAVVANPETGWLFEPSAPGPLRVALAGVLAIAAYGALTATWRACNFLLGWLLAPIGGAVMPALVLLVCAAISTSSFANLNAVYLPTAAIVAIIVIAMWGLSLLWTQLRYRRKAQ
jgi:hypothetical protein